MSDQDRKNNPTFNESGRGSGNASASSRDTMQEVKDKAASKVGEVKEQVMGEAQQRVSSVVSERKTRAADEIGSVAQAFRETSKRLREEDYGTVAQYADQLGDQVERVAGYLRDRDVSTMIGDLENMARRQPALFIGGAVAVGLLTSRFLKSSASSMSRGGSYGRDYGRDNGGREYGREYQGNQYGLQGGSSVGGSNVGGTGGTDVGSSLTSESLRNEVDDRRAPNSAQPGSTGTTSGTTGTTGGTTGTTSGTKADETRNQTDQSKEK